MIFFTTKKGEVIIYLYNIAPDRYWIDIYLSTHYKEDFGFTFNGDAAFETVSKY